MSTKPTAGERPAADTSTEESTVTTTAEHATTIGSVGDTLAGLLDRWPAQRTRQILAGREAARAYRAEHGAGAPALGVDPDDVGADVRERKAAARVAAWSSTTPADYAEARIADLAPDQSPAELAAWLHSDSRTLWLIGETGVGKTHAAWAIGRAAVDRGYLVRGWEHNAYLAELRPGGSQADPWRIRTRAKDASLLILDDLGAEMSAPASDDDPDGKEASEFIRRETITLLNARLGARHRQIITTNHSPATLGKLFGDRVISRLRHGASVVRFTGQDRRLSADW
jgi:DNA replication protein DnaC